MKLNKIIIFTAALSLSLGSCKKTLNQLPPQDLTSDIAFTNITAAETILNGCYIPMRNQLYYGRNFMVLPDITTDNLIAGQWFSNNYSSFQNNTYNSSTYEVVDLWRTIYQGIHRVNTLLKGIDKVTPVVGEDAALVNTKKQDFRAQALGLRALYLFDLVRTYSKIDLNDKLGVPMVTEPTIEINHARQTVKANYDQIIADLTLAETLFSTTNANSQVRVNKKFVNALQSRVYLYFKDYDNASKAADKVIAAGFAYDETAAGFNRLWSDDVSAKEIVFQLGIEAVKESPNVNYGVFFINDQGGAVLPSPDFVPSASLLALYAPGDLRYNAYFKSLKLRNYTPSNVITVNKYPGNPAFKAYADKANAPKLFRFAEVALNKMEAQYYLDKNTSKVLLKQLRAARIPGYNVAIVDGYDDTTLLNEIRNERRKELPFEAHRFFDLKRWGIGFSRPNQGNVQAPENAIGDIPASNYRFQWPIPQGERESNKLAEQNPGYAN